MEKIISLISLVMISAMLCLAFSSCAPTGKAAYDTSLTGEGAKVRMTKVKEQIGSMKADDFEPSSQKSDYVLIKIKDYGDIVVVLRGDIAPETVKNFKNLVSENFYDGTMIHRVVKNFMIQGGGYTYVEGDIREKNTGAIKGEFTENGFLNNLTHVRGVISMARLGDVKDSATSEFFIMHQTTTTLNGKYASFGYVLAGMDVVDAIASCEVDDPESQMPRPVVDVIIESIRFVQPK